MRTQKTAIYAFQYAQLEMHCRNETLSGYKFSSQMINISLGIRHPGLETLISQFTSTAGLGHLFNLYKRLFLYKQRELEIVQVEWVLN